MTFELFTVMRTQGSLRVVLNTKLWPNMTLEKGNEKSLRFTAMDSEKDIKIYLIMVSKLLCFLILHVLSDFLSSLLGSFPNFKVRG